MSESDRWRSSILEEGPALRTLLVGLGHVRAAIRAREGGHLRGLSARFRGRFRLVLLDLLDVLGEVRRTPECARTRLSGAGRVPPHEQDDEVERDREDRDARQRGRVEEEAIVRPAGGRKGPEVGSREGPVLVSVPYREAIAVDGAGEVVLLQFVPGAVLRVVRA